MGFIGVVTNLERHRHWMTDENRQGWGNCTAGNFTKNLTQCRIVQAFNYARKGKGMAVHITLKIKLGPLVSLDVTGGNCAEIMEALRGHEELNRVLDAMCGDLAERIYPEGTEPEEKKENEVQNEV